MTKERLAKLEKLVFALRNDLAELNTLYNSAAMLGELNDADGEKLADAVFKMGHVASLTEEVLTANRS